MSAILRIKRRIGEEPIPTIVLKGKQRVIDTSNHAACKEKLLETSEDSGTDEASAFLHFAGSISEEQLSEDIENVLAHLNENEVTKDIIAEASFREESEINLVLLENSLDSKKFNPRKREAAATYSSSKRARYITIVDIEKQDVNKADVEELTHLPTDEKDTVNSDSATFFYYAGTITEQLVENDMDKKIGVLHSSDGEKVNTSEDTQPRKETLFQVVKCTRIALNKKDNKDEASVGYFTHNIEGFFNIVDIERIEDINDNNIHNSEYEYDLYIPDCYDEIDNIDFNLEKNLSAHTLNEALDEINFKAVENEMYGSDPENYDFDDDTYEHEADVYENGTLKRLRRFKVCRPESDSTEGSEICQALTFPITNKDVSKVGTAPSVMNMEMRVWIDPTGYENDDDQVHSSLSSKDSENHALYFEYLL